MSGASLGLVLIVPVRIVPGAAVFNLFHGESEQEEVFFSGLFCHFDGRSVACSDRQRAVHHEFHVAGSAGLIAGGRNLIGDIAGGNEPFGQRHVVLRQKNDFHAATHDRDHRRSCPPDC